jgi:hypothetical protein
MFNEIAVNVFVDFPDCPVKINLYSCVLGLQVTAYETCDEK